MPALCCVQVAVSSSQAAGKGKRSGEGGRLRGRGQRGFASVGFKGRTGREEKRQPRKTRGGVWELLQTGQVGAFLAGQPAPVLANRKAALRPRATVMLSIAAHCSAKSVSIQHLPHWLFASAKTTTTSSWPTNFLFANIGFFKNVIWLFENGTVQVFFLANLQA